MKNLFKGTFLFAAVLCLFCMPTNVFAAANIEIYLNGGKLTFTTTQPVNKDNRVFAPIREIAEQLGFRVEYNQADNMATFEKDNLRVTHRIESNAISIFKNNMFVETKTYDVTSFINNDFTLVPVRMLGEALNAELSDSSNATTQLIYISVIEVKPIVNTISFSPSVVNSGERATITVNANSQTERVRLEGPSNTVIGELTNYTTNIDGSRMFIFEWSPTTIATGFQSVSAAPGDTAGYNAEGAKDSAIAVMALPKPVISNISTKSGKIYINDTVRFTVTTNYNAASIRISNDYDNKTIEATNYTTSGDSRIFQVDVKIEKTGSRKFTVEVGTTDGYVSEATKTHTIDVVSNSAVDKLAILDIELSPSEVRPNNSSTVTVTTSSYAVRVRIYDDNDNVVQTQNSPKSTDTYAGEKTWEFKVTPTSTGTHRYYAYAYESTSNSSDSVDQRFTLYASNNASSSSSSNHTIKDISADPDRVSVGGRTEITVVTSDEIDYLELFDYDGQYISYKGTPENTSSSRKEKTWVFERVYVESSSHNKFTVRAYYNNSNYVSDSININTGSSSGSGSDTSNGRIISVETNKGNYYSGDNILVTVRTSNDIDNVRMINETTSEIRNMYDYSNNSSTIWWETSFYANLSNGSRQTLRIEARDRDGVSYYETININIYD